jgi:hypothetical protein
MDPETQSLIRTRFSLHAVRCWNLGGKRIPRMVKLKTGAWTYTIAKAPDGYAITPENTSRNYARFVDLLLECLIEAQFNKKPTA